MKKIDQLSIRRQNLQRIWELFARRAVLTRHEIADTTGLSLMTVSNLVDHLNRHRVLAVSAPRDTGAAKAPAIGRRADLLTLNAREHAWLVLDLTELHMKLYALDLTLRDIVPCMRHAFRKDQDYVHNLRAFLNEARRTVAERLAGRAVLGVAVVAPGPYDIAGDRVVNQRIPALNSLLIKRFLREELGDYDYYVDEDVKLAVRAFMPLTVAPGQEVLYYLYLGEGVGGAALHHNNVLRGHNAAAGDAGQLLSPDGATYESRLSLRAFAARCGLTVSEQQSAEDILAALARFSAARDERYLAALADSATLIGGILQTVTWLLDPATVVIECPYAGEHAETLLTQVSSRLAYLLQGNLKTPALVSAPAGGRSLLSGAMQVLSREWIARIV